MEQIKSDLTITADVVNARIIAGRLYANVSHGYKRGLNAGTSIVTLSVINVGLVDDKLLVVTELGTYNVLSWKPL